jgi:hypothetical protein
MRSRKAIAALLAGELLLGACSSEEWTDDDRAPLIALCETAMPDEFLDFDPDGCEFLVETLEDFGCTLDDAAGAAADEELLARFPMISGDMLPKYPSCSSR